MVSLLALALVGVCAEQHEADAQRSGPHRVDPQIRPEDEGEDNERHADDAHHENVSVHTVLLVEEPSSTKDFEELIYISLNDKKVNAFCAINALYATYSVVKVTIDTRYFSQEVKRHVVKKT